MLATQNLIELEGTYPLPEGQLDRFLFNSPVLDYLSASDEVKVVDLTTATKVVDVKTVTSAEELLEFQQLVRMVPIWYSLAGYVVDARCGRRGRRAECSGFCEAVCELWRFIRAAQFIVLAAKARALRRKVVSRDV